eukprot:505060-Rhodomonas_salina.1
MSPPPSLLALCPLLRAGRPNRRKVTCLLYLNPEWKEGDGGEIEVRREGERRRGSGRESEGKGRE